MSTEHVWVVGLPADPSLLSLVDDVRSSASRASKADPGDRLDIVRFEASASRLEQAALSYPAAPRTKVSIPDVGRTTTLFGMDPDAWPRDLDDGVRSAARAFVAEQRLPVLVVDPYRPGATEAADTGAAEDPAEPWQAEAGVFGGRAVEARFRAQIAEAVDPDGGRRAPISPSGISNSVVTEILREFVVAAPGVARVDAPVEYRDGSKSAHPFPLRALPLIPELRRASLELKFSLLSIRHTEMDAVVHGAWLRNAEISRPRPAAQTDDLVYDISVRQLEELCRSGEHVRLHMYQTGLETAVVGFYRAVTTHLLRYPGSISVQPMYFVASPKPSQDKKHQPPSSRAGYRRGGDGSQRRRARTADPTQRDKGSRGNSPQHGGEHTHVGEPKVLLTESSTFRKGTVWST